MKKLMFAAVAVLGLSAFAAIESSNIVGYQGLQANATRQTMIAPTFLGVGNAEGCTLADLKVTGYEAPELVDDEWEGGCGGGDFILQFLNPNGTIAARYYWVDDGDVGPGWFATGGGVAIAGGAESVEINAGMALWVKGSGMKLQAAGAVNKADVEYVTNSSRQTAVGNATPVTLTLGDLAVAGYEEPELVDDEWEGGCGGGDFILQFLNPNGTVAARYYWVDDGDVGPGWFATGGGVAIDGGAESVEIPAGKGLWVKGSGMTLVIPAPAGL